jgi:uncharacterized protein (DUF305 family)
MSRTHRQYLRPLFLFLAAFTLLVGCSESSTESSASNDSSQSSESSESADFSNADLMFADMMIPHHQQAVEMSELALMNSSNPEIIALAEKIKSAQAPEIDQMQSWQESDSSEDHMGHGSESEDHSGHGMMGMLDEGQMSELERATGEEFDRLFLKGMIAHHEGAIDMAEMVVDSANAEAAALGKAIIESQTAEIEEMKTLLATIS